MDERIDIWDADGNPTGKTALKSEAHREGWYHPTVHVWFYTSDGRVLLQRRAEDKATDPGLWDVSVAGHVGAGESLLEGAVREIREEIGLEVSADQLIPITTVKDSRDHPGGIRDREFRHVYLCQLQKPFEALTPQQSEVAALKLSPLLQFAEETWGLARPGEYVPHGAGYYSRIVREVKKRL